MTRGRAKARVGNAFRVLNVAMLGFIAWLPEQCWEPACRWRAKRAVRPRHSWRRQLLAPGEVVGERDQTGLRRQRRADNFLERLPALRMYRPGGWQPSITVAGLGHLKAALAEGHGVILWVPEFQFSSLIAKLAMQRAGFAVHHLSRPGHGFGDSQFERKHLNRIRTRIEDRYLASRIPMPDNTTPAAMRVMLSLLADREVVSITVGDQARQVVRVPFFAGELALATGPLSLADRSGAPILPLVCGREPDGRFRVVVHRALPIAARDRESLQNAGNALAQLLEAACRRYPGQWQGWKSGAFTEERAVSEASEEPR